MTEQDLHWRLRDKLEDLTHRALEESGVDNVEQVEIVDHAEFRRYDVSVEYEGEVNLSEHVVEYVWNSDESEGFLMLHSSIQGEVYVDTIGNREITLKVYPRD